MDTTETVIIAEDSCGDELSQFVSWMKETYPEVEIIVQNTIHGDSQKYWDEYCNN